MWKQVNLNPHGKQVGDCTVRAISLATGKGWYDTYFGMALQGAIMCNMPSANSVTTAFLKRNGFRRRTIPDDCPDCYSVKKFCEDHKEGIYVLGTGTHMIAVIDGNYYDAWDSGDEFPVYYFAKEKEAD